MTHLSAEQVAQWIAGERTAESELHLAGCEECRAEVAAFEQTLSQFGRSARAMAVPSPQWRDRRRVAWPRWVAVAAALVVLASVPVYRQQRQNALAAREQQDTLLLQQVDASISRAVPGSMDPLVQMVSWSTSSTERKASEGQKQ